MTLTEDEDKIEPIQWLGDGVLDKTSKEYSQFESFIRDNDYSTVVDLEEEFFEIDRYAELSGIIFGKRYICYIEVDKRLEISKSKI